MITHRFCFRSAPKEFLTAGMGTPKKHECRYTQCYLIKSKKLTEKGHGTYSVGI